jgi:hypothetical protein
MTTKKNAKGSPAELIALIISQAPALIGAGITSLSIDGLAVTLAPSLPQRGETPAPDPVPTQHINPLRDSSTYPGGRVPGFDPPKDFE